MRNKVANLTWKLKDGILFRGDVKGGAALPVPSGDKSIVRHVLYLEGYGRTTPYLSATESKETAGHFANGQVYASQPSSWKLLGVEHRSRKELLGLLKGRGKGDAAWNNAFEVLQASNYVELHQEHLADFRSLSNFSVPQLRALVDTVFY
jgi:hypothetical protein